MAKPRTPATPSSPVRFHLTLSEQSADLFPTRLAALSVVRSLRHQLPTTPSAVGDLGPIAVGGIGAIALMSSRAAELPPELPLLCAFGTPQDALQLLARRHHRSTLDDEIAARIVSNSQFLHLTSESFAQPVTATPPADGTALGALNRGARMLSTAALRGASVSMVSLECAVRAERLSIPHLSPGGVLLELLGHLGHAAGVATTFRSAIERARPTATPEELAPGIEYAARQERHQERVGTELQLVLPRVLAMYKHHRNDAYRPVTDPILEDSDVIGVITHALRARSAMGVPYLSPAERSACRLMLGDIQQEATIIAAGGAPKALRSTRTTPRQSPPGR